MTTRPKNLDINQLAKRIVDEAVGDELVEPTPEEKNLSKIRSNAAKSRMGKLTEEQRIDIARVAALARWKKSD